MIGFLLQLTIGIITVFILLRINNVVLVELVQIVASGHST